VTDITKNTNSDFTLAARGALLLTRSVETAPSEVPVIKNGSSIQNNSFRAIYLSISSSTIISPARQLNSLIIAERIMYNSSRTTDEDKYTYNFLPSSFLFSVAFDIVTPSISSHSFSN
jgi:hypothetical protein